MRRAVRSVLPYATTAAHGWGRPDQPAKELNRAEGTLQIIANDVRRHVRTAVAGGVPALYPRLS